MEGDKFVQVEEPYLVELGKANSEGKGENGGLNLKDYVNKVVQDEQGNEWQVFYDNKIDPKTGEVAVLGKSKISDVKVQQENEIKQKENELRMKEAETAKESAFLIQGLRTLYKPEYAGFFDSMLPDIAVGQEQKEFRSMVRQLQSRMTRAISGAAVSEHELKMLKTWMPDIGMNQGTFQESLKILEEWTARKMNPDYNQQEMDEWANSVLDQSIAERKEKETAKVNDNALRGLNDF